METVFVSSTFVDLENHRAAVRDSLRVAGFLDVAMETLGARDERPLKECLRLVRESNYFVGVYAHRYGFVPDDSEVSITQAEYEAAPNDRFIYLVDTNTPWLPNHIDKGASADRLTKFKTTLKRHHICNSFTTPDNLAKSVVADVSRAARSRDIKPIDQLEVVSGGEPIDWGNERITRYEDRRYLNLVHALEPSKRPDQEFDILIYLYRHRMDDTGGPFELDDVAKAEFFWGHFGATAYSSPRKTGDTLA